MLKTVLLTGSKVDYLSVYMTSLRADFGFPEEHDDFYWLHDSQDSSLIG